MEDIVMRPRYPRHGAASRRRKKYGRERNGKGLAVIIGRQLVICVTLLAVIGLIKNINTPATNFITGNIQAVLRQNIDLKSIYDTVDAFLAGLKDNSLFGKRQDTDKAVNAPVGEGETADSAKEPQAAKGTASPARMIAPVKGALSSGFGERSNPVTYNQKAHEGIDIGADQGEHVLAALDGVVVETGESPSYGKYLKIRHDQGLLTLYAHCSVLEASQGKVVKQGDSVARVGDTGISTGAHLHFEVWKDGKPVNPLDFVSIGEE